VDTKKKELVGDFSNNGQEWRPKGDPEKVRTHDFVDKELGRATPYGIYDVGRNSGWVSVGVDRDTAEFAVETIRRKWPVRGAMVANHGPGHLSGCGTLVDYCRKWPFEAVRPVRGAGPWWRQ